MSGLTKQKTGGWRGCERKFPYGMMTKGKLSEIIARIADVGEWRLREKGYKRSHFAADWYEEDVPSLLDEVDKWKKRAEALERTINYDCRSCKHVGGKKIIVSESTAPCNDCFWWEHWELDEARFAK